MIFSYGMVESVETVNDGDFLTADQSAGSTVLPVDNTDIFETETLTGSVRINGVVYAYNAVDPDASTITLTSGLVAAAIVNDSVYVSPLVPVKVAQIILDGLGGSEPARVPRFLSPLLPYGVREVGKREYALLLTDEKHNDSLLLDVLGSAATENTKRSNLCSDPKPTDYLNWVGGAGGGSGAFTSTALDSTHADLGLHVAIDHGIGAATGWLAPNGSGTTVDTAWPTGTSSIAAAVKTYPLSGDLQFQMRVLSPPGDLQLTGSVEGYDSAGAMLFSGAVGGMFLVNPVQTAIRGISYSYRVRTDFAGMVAVHPSIASIAFTLACAPTDVYAFTNAKTFYGSFSAYDVSDLELGTVIPYRDGDSADWTLNNDGTSTGTVDARLVSWFDINDLPTVFYTPPAPATVANQAALLALTPAIGQIAKQTDTGRTFILKALPASTLGNWQPIVVAPADVFGFDPGSHVAS